MTTEQQTVDQEVARHMLNVLIDKLSLPNAQRLLGARTVTVTGNRVLRMADHAPIDDFECRVIAELYQAHCG